MGGGEGVESQVIRLEKVNYKQAFEGNMKLTKPEIIFKLFFQSLQRHLFMTAMT